jgi:hypothetical protein
MMGQRTTPLVEPAELPGRISSDEPRPLPYSAYPKARDVAQHGVQPLPASLPLIDFTSRLEEGGCRTMLLGG